MRAQPCSTHASDGVASHAESHMTDTGTFKLKITNRKKSNMDLEERKSDGGDTLAGGSATKLTRSQFQSLSGGVDENGYIRLWDPEPLNMSVEEVMQQLINGKEYIADGGEYEPSIPTSGLEQPLQMSHASETYPPQQFNTSPWDSFNFGNGFSLHQSIGGGDEYEDGLSGFHQTELNASLLPIDYSSTRGRSNQLSDSFLHATATALLSLSGNKESVDPFGYGNQYEDEDEEDSQSDEADEEEIGSDEDDEENRETDDEEDWPDLLLMGSAPSPDSFTTISTASTAEHKGCRLLALPAELRNRIYEYTLPTSVQLSKAPPKTLMKKDEREFYAQQDHRAVSQGSSTRDVGLLLTCKQIHLEAVQLYYANATFEAPDIPSIESWVRSIGDVKTELVKSIHLMDPLGDAEALDDSDGWSKVRLSLKMMNLSIGLLGFGIPFNYHKAIMVQTKRTGEQWVKVADIDEADGLLTEE